MFEPPSQKYGGPINMVALKNVQELIRYLEILRFVLDERTRK